VVVVPIEWLPYVIILILACYAWEYYSRATAKRDANPRLRKTYRRPEPEPEIRLNPQQVQDARTASKKGMALFRGGEFKEAQKCFESAAHSNPANAQHKLLVAAAETKLGNPQGAKSQVESLLMNELPRGRTWQELGVFYSNLDVLDLAVHCFEKAVYLSPKEPEYVRNLAIAYRNSGQVDKAISFAQSKLKQHEKSDRVLRVLADLYLIVGKYETAEKYARDAITVQPRDAPLHVMLGDILYRKGDVRGSEEAFDGAKQIDLKNPETLVRIGYAHINHLEMNRAEKEFGQALDIMPQHPGALEGLKVLKELSSKEISVEELHKKAAMPFEFLSPGEVLLSSGGHGIRLDILDALADDRKDTS
jgi:tetratricopeptide (TPR) repeat protein